MIIIIDYLKKTIVKRTRVLSTFIINIVWHTSGEKSRMAAKKGAFPLFPPVDL
jgi:hypothetical protein